MGGGKREGRDGKHPLMPILVKMFLPNNFFLFLLIFNLIDITHIHIDIDSFAPMSMYFLENIKTKVKVIIFFTFIKFCKKF